MPQVKEVLVDLLAALREKLAKIGVSEPQGRIVQAVLVDKAMVAKVVDDLRDTGMAVYVASRDIEGVRLRDNAMFVCDTMTQLPVGALAVPFQVTTMQRQAILEVWQMLPEDAEDVQRAKAEEAEEMQRYREGLADPSRYVPPPRKRLSQLFSTDDEDDDSKYLSVIMGPLVAKTLPPDALLWARALMQRRKDAGEGLPTYRLDPGVQARAI